MNQHSTTVAEAREAWHTAIHADGGTCPVCERFGKVYVRALNRTMALGLQWLYGENEKKGVREWIDVPNTAPKFVLRSNQLASLRWWGLVERQLPDPDDKTRKHSGMWRITLRGCDFVEGLVAVPFKVHTYNAEAIGSSSESVLFKDIIGEFNCGNTVNAVSSLADRLTARRPYKE